MVGTTRPLKNLMTTKLANHLYGVNAAGIYSLIRCKICEKGVKDHSNFLASAHWKNKSFHLSRWRKMQALELLDIHSLALSLDLLQFTWRDNFLFLPPFISQRFGILKKLNPLVFIL